MKRTESKYKRLNRGLWSAALAPWYILRGLRYLYFGLRYLIYGLWNICYKIMRRLWNFILELWQIFLRILARVVKPFVIELFVYIQIILFGVILIFIAVSINYFIK